jgi:hypothetical protein
VRSAEPPGIRTGSITELPKTFNLFAFGTRGPTTLCGYTKENGSIFWTYTTSTTFIITPSRAELEAQAEEQAAKTRRQEQETREAAKKMEEAQVLVNEIAARESQLASYLSKVALEGECAELPDPLYVGNYVFIHEEANILAARTCKADEAADEASALAEQQAAEAKANANAVRSLSVRIISHPGSSSRHPGETELDIRTVPFAQVILILKRYGHRREQFQAIPDTLSATSAEIDVPIGWTCKRPGSTYRYVVSAHTDTGQPIVRTGSFAPVSVQRCHLFERREREAREQHERRYTEEVERQERQERERLERFEANCRTLGGTPVTLYTSEGSVRSCRAPNGGTLRVP